MTLFIGIVSFVAGIEVGLFIVAYLRRTWREEQSALWQLCHELEADKRQLVESLCRAEGKPFIAPPVPKAMREPSEGWFDGPVRITVKPSTK